MYNYICYRSKLNLSLKLFKHIQIQRQQIVVVAKKCINVSQLFISRVPKMRVILYKEKYIYLIVLKIINSNGTPTISLLH